MTDATPTPGADWPPASADEPPFDAIAAEMREWLGDDATGHDMAHAWRVFDLGTRIADAEGADVEVVGAAALVHDLHRVMDGQASVHPSESLPEVRAILDAAAFPAGKVDAVCHCVAVHDEYAYRGNPDATDSLEAEVLQDADNLDATGAVGIARCFAFTGAYGNPLWAPGEETPSAIDHFHEKLLKLPDEMNTATAADVAAERHAFLVEFVERFEREWVGEA